tara:strand:+ start:1047 stop:1322 length:276 start_codon:yes stop_codon:yes gene_type:complete
MAVNYSINKPKEPEDNMRYAERKAARMVTNGLNNQLSDDKLLSKEKKDFEMLKVKESKRDIFGPLTTKETERLQNLNVKREKEDEDLTGGM